MRQGKLPIYDSKMTYSELTQSCESAYKAVSDDLIDKTNGLLVKYAAIVHALDAFNLLTEINDAALELSALHSGWDSFSLAVFEDVVIRAKTSNATSSRTLREAFDSALNMLN